nr:MAG: capsid protein [ssDNA virus sp.]
MAYKRKYTPRRSTRRRRAAPWYKKKYSVAQIAVKAAKGVRYLSGLVNSEKFKFDVNGTTNLNSFGTVIPLTSIPIGNSDEDRTGNSIFVRHITNRLSFSLDPAHTGLFQRCRVMLFIDTQQYSDTTPTVGAVLETVGVSAAYMSLLNTGSVGRFRILKSTYVTLNADKPTRTLDWDFNLRHHVRYNGPLGSDIQKGGLYLLAISDQPTNGDLPTMQYLNRVSYHDN